MATPLALVWDLIARDQASPAFARVGAAAEGTAAKTASASKHIALFATAVAATGAAVAIHAVKMAGDFQYQMNRMTTAAGESQKNLKLISDGVLNVMSATGTSAKEAAAGLYLIESAGYHGAAGLQVLTNVAKGAKIENADLATVANAVSSAMVDYHVSAANSSEVMNTLIAAVAHGKTTLADMSTAFSNVGAAGASANVPMADLAAAIATMTMHGTDAAKAGTYLRQVIGQLEAPSAKARKVMESLGLDANKVGQTLSSGPGGLASAISMLETAITSHLTPAGLVALEVFKKSKDPVTAYQRVLANLPPSLVTSFGALAQMTGGVRSLQGFLQLGGENLKTFRSNTLAVNEAVKAGGKNIEGWASTQKTFNVRMDQFRQTINTLFIRLGTALIPLFTRAAVGLTAFVSAFSHPGPIHQFTVIIGDVLRKAFADVAVVISGLTALYHEHEAIIKQVAALIAGTLVATLIGLQLAFTATSTFISHHKTLVESLGAGVLAAAVAYNVWKVSIAAWAAVQKGAIAVQAAFNAVMDANPILLAVTAIAGLAAGLIYAYKHSQTFRDIVHAVLNGLKIAARDVEGAFKATVAAVVHAWDNVAHAYSNVAHAFDNVKHAFDNTLNALKVAWRDTWGAIKAVWDAVSPTLKVIGEIFYAIIGGTILASIDAAKLAWQVLWGFFKLQWDTVGRPVVMVVAESIKLMWDGVKLVFAGMRLAWNALWAFFQLQWTAIGRPVFNAVKFSIGVMWDGVKVIFTALRTQWGLMWSAAKVAWDTVGAPIFAAIKTVVGGLWSFLSDTFGKISTGWNVLWSGFPKVFGTVWDGISDAAAAALNGIIDVLNAFIHGIDWILDKLPGGFHIGDIPQVRAFHGSSGKGATGGAGGAGLQHAYALGGVVPGYAPGRDVVGALLSPGEGILVPEATRALGGAAGIQSINAMFSSRVSGGHKFGIGGVVGAVVGGIEDFAKAAFSKLGGAALSAAEIPVRAALKLLPKGILRSLGTGLFDRVDGGIRSALFDSGGFLMPGMTLAVNNTGRPERVLTNGQADKLGGRWHGDVHFHHHNPLPETVTGSLPRVQRQLQYALDR